MSRRKAKPASAQLRRDFDAAVATGASLEDKFSNFEQVPDVWLIKKLIKCSDIAPDATCDSLICLRRSPYMELARELRRWLAMQQSRSAAA